MGRAIAIFNQKGGVGKTTTNINLGASLAQLGKKVLMLDIDPQGNTTSGIGVSKKDLEYTVYDLLIDAEFDTRKAVMHTNVEGLDLIPANTDLAGAEIELVELDGREQRLRHAIDRIRDDYDFIFIDCPPQLGRLTINALIACDSVIIPCPADYLPYRGMQALLRTVRELKEINTNLQVNGIIVTLYESNVKDQRTIYGMLGELAPILGTVRKATDIKRNVVGGLPVVLAMPDAKVSTEYAVIAGKI